MQGNNRRREEGGAETRGQRKRRGREGRRSLAREEIDEGAMRREKANMARKDKKGRRKEGEEEKGKKRKIQRGERNE